MSINRSQKFMYFQNKTKHYQNIKKAKATVDDKLSKSLRHTIDHSQSKSRSRLQAHLKNNPLDAENQKIISRLSKIVVSKRKQLQVQGDYSRYNNTKRPFRTKNPYRDQLFRKIQLENQQIVQRLQKVGPLVGKSSDWSAQYKLSVNHRKNLSKYDDSQRSKGSLYISTGKFVPQHYKTLLDKSQQVQRDGRTVVIIPKQKLISFPKIIKKQRSNSSIDHKISHQSTQL